MLEDGRRGTVDRLAEPIFDKMLLAFFHWARKRVEIDLVTDLARRFLVSDNAAWPPYKPIEVTAIVQPRPEIEF